MFVLFVIRSGISLKLSAFPATVMVCEIEWEIFAKWGILWGLLLNGPFNLL